MTVQGKATAHLTIRLATITAQPMTMQAGPPDQHVFTTCASDMPCLFHHAIQHHRSVLTRQHHTTSLHFLQIQAHRHAQ